MAQVTRDMLDLMLQSNMSTVVETVKSFVQIMFDGVQRQIDVVKSENSDLKQSLEFTQANVLDLENTVKAQAVVIKNLQKHEQAVPSIEDRVRSMEDQSRAANLRISGLTTRQSENPEQTMYAVQKLITEKLEKPGIKVLSAYRVKSNDSTAQNDTVVAKLASSEQRTECLRAASKLKGTDVYLNDDVSHATMLIRRSKLDELKMKRRGS